VGPELRERRWFPGEQQLLVFPGGMWSALPEPSHCSGMFLCSGPAAAIDQSWDSRPSRFIVCARRKPCGPQSCFLLPSRSLPINTPCPWAYRTSRLSGIKVAVVRGGAPCEPFIACTFPSSVCQPAMALLFDVGLHVARTTSQTDCMKAMVGYPSQFMLAPPLLTPVLQCLPVSVPAICSSHSSCHCCVRPIARQ
jgi:hypothetical protein